jgi:hypothetical protein
MLCVETYADRDYRDERGRAMAPITWLSVVCDGCGAEGPKIVGNGAVESHWDAAFVTARAESAGFVPRTEGRIRRHYCATCDANRQPATGKGRP